MAHPQRAPSGPSESTILHARVVVLGSGIAGLAAALQAARLGTDVLVIEGGPGGTLFNAPEVDDFPGLPAAATGPSVIERARAQVEAAGVRFVRGQVARVHLEREPFSVDTDAGRTITADALVLATGGRARRLGVPGEDALRGYGVSDCATCDGFFCTGQDVLVVGGGDTALTDALHLTQHAARVTLAHPGAEPSAQHALIVRARANPKITWLPCARAIQVHGEPGQGGVTGATLVDERSGEARRIACQALYVAVGREPATEPFHGQLELDGAGYVVRPAGWSAATSRPGVFAAGECADARYGQAITAAALGCMAAWDATRWLATNEQQRAARSVVG